MRHDALRAENMQQFGGKGKCVDFLFFDWGINPLRHGAQCCGADVPQPILDGDFCAVAPAVCFMKI